MQNFKLNKDDLLGKQDWTFPPFTAYGPKRFKEIEKVILPFLYNLSKSDEPYIHWPNRGPIIKAQIEKVLKLTRG